MTEDRSLTPLRDKSVLRKHYQRVRNDFAATPEAKAACAQLVTHLRKVLPNKAGLCASYLNKSGEASLEDFHRQPEGWQLAVPRVDGDDLDFFLFDSEADMPVNRWGIREPRPEGSQAVDLSQCQVVLVPGVAFDIFGHRLGHGKGFYDRALAKYSGLKVGVAFEVQIDEKPLPADSHDVVMDWIVTEKRTIQTQPAAGVERMV